MAEEIDDNEFFQQDFTTASEWEIFNARLDEIFHEWKLPYVEVKRPLRENELFLADWETKMETIFFADVELKVTRHYAKIADSDNMGTKENPSSLDDSKICQAHLDLMNIENNFSIYGDKSERIHPIAKWYGLRDFVVIDPVGSPLINESQIRVLLSSACITVAEVNTHVPVFVHIMIHNLNVYLGVCESPMQRVNFDIIALEHTPPTCKYLAGLLSMFKAKIGHHYIAPITISVRFTYSLIEFLNANYTIKCKIPFSFDSDEESEEMNSTDRKFYALPYGVSMDPISELILNCTWPKIAENIILDSATHSDLDPILSPFWSVRVNFKHQPLYFLTDAIMEYLKWAENTTTLSSIIGSSYDFGSTLNFEGNNPLDMLTESKIPSLSSVLPSVRSSNTKKSKAKKTEGPIKEEELMQMLYYMFPDAQTDPTYPYDENESFDTLRIKSAVPDSLVFRLSTLVATCNSYFGGCSAVAHLWAEFTQEMRYRVERYIQIPGVSPGYPDSRTCLLHQKLQMLNICMERRRLREGGLPFSMTQQEGKSEKDDSEDEFYDCATDEETEGNNYPLWKRPEGRRSKLGNLTLIDSSEQLYVPITQEPVTKTEDQLEDDAEVMLKLGPGSEICTQMMSASLLSDMESFKAANPNGKLEDFIRWYSPRDWIEEPDETGVVRGHLSQRMLIPGNTWQTVWSQAKPVSARRQRRLFDDTKEAEKVLHYFETRTIGQICRLTLPALYHSAMLKIKSELKHSNFADSFNEKFDKILTNLCKLSRESWSSNNINLTHIIPSYKKWETLLYEISNLEQLTIQTNSIALKLFGDVKYLKEDEKNMILTMIKGIEVELSGGAKNPISVRILGMFSDARQSKDEFNTEKDAPSQLYLPEPIKKEYILRVDGKTTGKTVGGPQFLRAILDKHMRLCGAFTTNTTFV